MKIETRYNIGDKIYVVYNRDGEASIYEDEIAGIGVEKKIKHTPYGNTTENVVYYYGVVCPDDIDEEDIVLRDNPYDLVNKVKEVLNETNKV